VTTTDRRVERFRPLTTPAMLLEDLPLTEAGAATVNRSREEIVRILDGQDDRLIVVVGPCSIHDPAAGLEYGRRLAAISNELSSDLHIVMRGYFEKPRTTVGWKGLLNDPQLDGSCRTNEGLKVGRRLLLDLLDLGVTVGCELLDPISPQYLSDLIVWGQSARAPPRARCTANLPQGCLFRLASRTALMVGSRSPLMP
jgi:3-deoxy-7-phosphoheptulonate synthase